MCRRCEGAPAVHVALRSDANWALEEASQAEVEREVLRARAWVEDVVASPPGRAPGVCPFTASADLAGTSLGAARVPPGAVLWPVCAARGCGAAATVAVVAAFWRATCELLSSAPEEASSTLLAATHYATEDHGAFLNAADVMVRNLKLVQGDDAVALVFFHPLYDRDDAAIVQDRPSHGHLPPSDWLRGYLRLTHSEAEVDSVSDEQLRNANYQRRAPTFLINLLRADQVAAAEAVVPSSVIEPSPGRRVRVTGARVYATNTWRLATAATTKQDDGGHTYLVAARGKDAV